LPWTSALFVWSLKADCLQPARSIHSLRQIGASNKTQGKRGGLRFIWIKCPLPSRR